MPSPGAGLPPPPARFHRWLLALAAALVAAVARVAIQPLVGDALPFVFAFPACVLVALRCGAAPGVLTGLGYGALIALPGVPPDIAPADLPMQMGVSLVALVVTAVVCAQFAGPRDVLADAGALRPDTPLTRWMRSVLVGAALIPLIIFLTAAWWGYQRAMDEAHQTVVRFNNVVSSHAGRTLDAAEHLAATASRLADRPDAELREAEADVHRQLSNMAAAVPSLMALSVWNADGQPLVSSGTYPVPEEASISNRRWFREMQASGERMIVTGLVKGRLQNKPLFNLMLRRQTADGRFAGIVAASLSPAYFEEFYASLATEESGLNTFALYIADGTLLTRWPPPPQEVERLPDDSPLLGPAREGQVHDVLLARSALDGQRRLVSFRRLDSLPLYASTSLSETAVLAQWRRFVGLLAAVLLPVTLGLVWVSFVALKKTRREQAALLELRAEMRRREQAEQSALQSQKLEALAQLTGGVAHDFNNLLAIVNGNLHLLKRKLPASFDSRPVDAIARAAAAGVRLTRQLLSFSRKQAINPQRVVLQHWLPTAAGLLGTTLGNRVSLQLEVDALTPPIAVDTAELELALINLAVNARDAMPQGGTLRITAHAGAAAPGADEPPPAPRVAICVTDSGTGIAPDIVHKVFEPFFTTKASGKGTGLGLSQVYGFCVQAGGTATVSSGPGEGTTVTLLLPVAPALEPAEAPPHPALLPTLAGKVLLVEDNEDVAATYAAVLRSSGLEVESAASADAALERLAAQPTRYDVVVSDVAMPGTMDGIQFALKLRVVLPALRVVLMTGYAERLEQALAAGLKVLGKPVDADVLLAEVKQALDTRAKTGPQAQA